MARIEIVNRRKKNKKNSNLKFSKSQIVNVTTVNQNAVVFQNSSETKLITY